MSEEWTLSSFHKKTYSPDRCAESVWDRIGGWHHYQCSRKRGHGPEQAFCKQHSPDAKKARKDAQEARWRVEQEERRKARAIRSAKDEALNACRAIAAGHNDPRGLAQKVVDMAEGLE